MENNLGVALVKRLCPVCLAEIDGEIIMNSLLTEKNKNEVEELHGKVVGFSEEFCENCKSMKTEDSTFVVGVIPEKSEDVNNPFRSGHISLIKTHVFNENVDTSKGMLYMDVKEGLEHGIFKENVDEKENK